MVGGLERHAAKPAETDLGDTAPGLEAADGADAAIDAAFAERAPRHLDPERLRLSERAP